MTKISIVNRAMTSEEIDLMDKGFDELYAEEGVDVERKEIISFVANLENTIIGCVSGSAFKSGDNYTEWFYIDELFVEKAYRSDGLGTKLVVALENHLKTLGIKRIWLWTSGDKAIRFYRRQGYNPFTKLENWYSDGSDRVGLRKDI